MFDVWVQGDVQEFAMMVKNAMEAGTKQRPGRRSARLGANKTSTVDKPPSSGPSTRANSKRKREPEADNPMVVDEPPASTVSVESPVIEGEMAAVNQDSLLRSTATLSISDDVVTETGYSKRRKITPTNSESNLSTQGMVAQQKYHGFISTSPVEIDADQGQSFRESPFTPLSRTHQSSTDSDRPRPPERRVSTLSSLLLPEEKDNKHADHGRYLDHNHGERQLSTSNTSQVERFRSTPPPLSYPTLPPFHTLLEVASPKKQGYEHRREDDPVITIIMEVHNAYILSTRITHRITHISIINLMLIPITSTITSTSTSTNTMPTPTPSITPIPHTVTMNTPPRLRLEHRQKGET
ncbi:hypothetical protein FS842_007763, partial [Serendipita sp. 407]